MWPRSKKAVANILGPTTEKELSRDLNIVWVWGIDKLHEKGTHEYAWVMDSYVNALLPQVPHVTVVPSMYFPKKELWEKADLVVFYLWPREQWDYDFIDAYFRIILLRAMAWAMNESFDPFKPLVVSRVDGQKS